MYLGLGVEGPEEEEELDDGVEGDPANRRGRSAPATANLRGSDSCNRGQVYGLPEERQEALRDVDQVVQHPVRHEVLLHATRDNNTRHNTELRQHPAFEGSLHSPKQRSAF